jgi:4-hydroxybenzoyl-CoA reductase subunit beta
MPAMMRLPLFQFHAPRTLSEIAQILNDEGENAMVLAGGTDLLPNMKRRQQTPRTLVSLRNVPKMRQIQISDSGFRLGACLTLAEIAQNPSLRGASSALWQAALQVATPLIRNMATLGGNLCLDTRCNYLNQSYEWRKAIDFCLKKDGTRCWVAPNSKKCMAVSSTDAAPALIALGARVRLVSHAAERELLLADLYNDNGLHYLTRRRDEILTEVLVDSLVGWKSTYWKLRRRGSFDFPVLSVAAAVSTALNGIVVDARIVIGSVSSRPLVAADATNFLIGKPLNHDVIDETAARAFRLAKPLDNTDFEMSWRKKVTTELVKYALWELSGEDVSAQRKSVTRQEFYPADATMRILNNPDLENQNLDSPI